MYLLVLTGVITVLLPSIGHAEGIFKPGELLIKLRPGLEAVSITYRDEIAITGISSLDSLNSKFKVFKISKVFHKATAPTTPEEPDLRLWYKVKFPEDKDVLQAVREYRDDPNVVYAEPNYIFTTCATPNDPGFSSQWGLHNTGQTGGTADCDIDAPEAWDIHTGSGVVIAVIDTGVDHDHPDLADNMWTNPDEDIDGNDDDGNGYVDDVRGWDFFNDDNDPMDDNGHGTHCAGIVSAVSNNGVGVSGVGWANRIMPLKFMNALGMGSTDDAAEAIRYAADNGAKVLSNSWGASPGVPLPDAIKEAIDYAIARGCVVAFAAGNDEVETETYPAAYEPVIAVAATDHNDRKATGWGPPSPGSNYGVWVDVSAPGDAIYSTVWDNSYATYSGTSMACPFVAGLAGLILSHNPGLSNSEVRERIERTADNIDHLNPGYEGRLGSGRINAHRALQAPEVLPEEIRVERTYTYPSPYNLTEHDEMVLSIEMNYPIPPDGISMEIYDITGELVHKVDSEDIQVNGSTFIYRWDGRNDDGRKVGSGVYICWVRIEWGGEEEERFIKIAVIR